MQYDKGSVAISHWMTSNCLNYAKPQNTNVFLVIIFKRFIITKQVLEAIFFLKLYLQLSFEKNFASIFHIPATHEELMNVISVDFSSELKCINKFQLKSFETNLIKIY
jgi:hypothetical protein